MNEAASGEAGEVTFSRDDGRGIEKHHWSPENASENALSTGSPPGCQAAANFSWMGRGRSIKPRFATPNARAEPGVI